MAQEPVQIRAVIFDMGGVIYRTDNPVQRTALAERLGLTREELDDIVFHNPVALRAERGEATVEEAWRKAARLLHRPVQEIPEIRRQFFADDRVDFDLIAFIQKLRPHYTTALLSNTWIADLPRFLREDLQIPDTFDVVISSAQQNMRKPEPEIFRLALDLVKARPEEAVFVDDFARNTSAAAELGMHTIQFRTAQQTENELRVLLRLDERSERGAPRKGEA